MMMTKAKPKGHWPRHKPRHPETASLTARKALLRLRRFFLRHRQHGRANPVSLRSAALAIGVSTRTLLRWLYLKHHPNPAHYKKLVAWRASRPED